MRNMARALLASFALGASLLALGAPPSRAEGEPAGKFDYYVLALSWSPSYCALQGDARGDDQCHPRHDYSFTLHGLWPQYERGWPSYCTSTARDPARSDTAAMADIMGSAGLAWHQWKKHGRCSGLGARDYFATARRAYGAITLPPVLAGLSRDVTLAPQVVEAALLEVNPQLDAQSLTITCAAGLIHEARICLNRDLTPRACGADVARDCRASSARLPAVR